MTLHFVVPGKPVTGNHARGNMGVMRWSKKRGAMVPGVRTFVTDKATTYRDRVKGMCFAAARIVGWTMPEYCRVDIAYYNIRLDRDNVMKEVDDAMQGVAYAHDSRILDGWTRKCWDDGGERVEILVAPVDRRDYDSRSKRRKGQSPRKLA